MPVIIILGVNYGGYHPNIYKNGGTMNGVTVGVGVVQ
jgi:hypothetical protein